jgi:hypothetical protein
LRVLKPLRCRGCGSPGVRRGGGSRPMQRALDGNGMGGGLQPHSVIQVCERQLGRWAPSRSLPGPGVRPTPPLVSARHRPPVAPTPPWCPADTPRSKYRVRRHKEGGCTRTQERPFVVFRHRGRLDHPVGVGHGARRAGPAERRRPSLAGAPAAVGSRDDRGARGHSCRPSDRSSPRGRTPGRPVIPGAPG